MPSMARQGRKPSSLVNSKYHCWWTAVRKSRVRFNIFAATNHHRRQSFIGIFRPQVVSFLFTISIFVGIILHTSISLRYCALLLPLKPHVVSHLIPPVSQSIMMISMVKVFLSIVILHHRHYYASTTWLVDNFLLSVRMTRMS